MKDLRSVVLTGASGGLGLALAKALSAPDRHLLLIGRNPERLAQAEKAVLLGGGTAEIAQIDLRETARLITLLRDFDARHPIDLLIANAGVKAGNANGIEPAAQVGRIIAVNLTATILMVQSVLPAMQDRTRGQIAIVSSMAALSPHADLLSYSATKAALVSYGTALRRAVRLTGIKVSVILPGFIDTDMTTRQKGPAPLLITADRAATIILRGLSRNKARIAFPRLLMMLAWLMERLPAPLADRISDGFRATIEPDDDERNA